MMKACALFLCLSLRLVLGRLGDQLQGGEETNLTYGEAKNEVRIRVCSLFAPMPLSNQSCSPVSLPVLLDSTLLFR